MMITLCRLHHLQEPAPLDGDMQRERAGKTHHAIRGEKRAKERALHDWPQRLVWSVPICSKWTQMGWKRITGGGGSPKAILGRRLMVCFFPSPEFSIPLLPLSGESPKSKGLQGQISYDKSGLRKKVQHVSTQESGAPHPFLKKREGVSAMGTKPLKAKRMTHLAPPFFTRP